MVKIRPATPDDMPAVLELIRELARYERAEEQVRNSVEQLVEDGFGKNAAFECRVAEHEDRVIGFALFYGSYSTWRGKCLYLEDICVSESFRRQGVGKQLFDEVLRIARSRNMKRMEWQVLDWNEPAIGFYRKYQAHLDPEWINGKIFLD